MRDHEDNIIQGGLFTMINYEDRVFQYSGILSFLLEDIPNKITEAIYGVDEKIQINKANREEYFKAIKELDCPLIPPVSEELSDRIYHIAKDNQIVSTILYSRASHASRLIRFAMYYMINDRAKLMVLDPDEKVFVNTITAEAGFGRIYHDSDCKDLSDYEIRPLKKPYPKFVVIESEVRELLEQQDFIEKWQGRIIRTSKYDPTVLWFGNSPVYNGRVDENGLYHPVFFSTASSTPRPKQGVGVTNEAFLKFENAFGKYFNDDAKYHYEFENDGNYYLYLTRPEAFNAEDKYLLDDGRILGGTDPSILTNIIIDGIQDTVFVNAVKHPNIVNKILTSTFYSLTKDDYYEACLDLFDNGLIYRNIDFTNTGFMDSFTDEERYRFGQILSQITHVINNNARYRFFRFDNIEEFTLVSDEECNSTLALLGATASAIEINGKIEVANGMIKKSKKGVTEFQISLL